MLDSRFKIGAVVTEIWIVGLLVAGSNNLEALGKLKPNEWGDLFGGFFAPLAFLWLVLGYLQQGEELRLSTEALRLQADELRHSVDQQRELVEVSRAQLDNDRNVFREESLQRTRAARPQFTISNRGVAHSSGITVFTLLFINGGNTVRSVLGVISGLSGGNPNLVDLPICQAESQHQISFQLVSPFPESDVTLTVTYIDSLGAEGATVFNMSLPRPNDLVFRQIES